MKLRARLALTVLLGLLPIVGAMLWFHGRLHRASFEEGVAQAVISRMRAGGRERCEQDPARFGRMRPHPRKPRGRHRRRRGLGPRAERLAAYSADLRPSSPSAASLPPAVVASLRDGDPFTTERLGPGGGVRYTIRMPWRDGPCAVISVRRPAPPRAPRPILPFVLLSTLAAALAFLAAAPVVRRIRRLTHAVADSPDGESVALDLSGKDEVADLARAFHAKQQKLTQQMRQLKQRDRALSEHLANTMHDVMIPLTVLEGHLMSLRAQLRTKDDKSAPVLAAAIEETHYIATLLTNLDAWARLDAGEHTLAREPVDLGLLVERVVARHLPVARERGVELAHATPDEPVWLMGDETLLERAVGNLVHNAVRHNQAGGHVAVVLEGVGTNVELRVLDDGPGMSPEDARRMLARGAAKDPARSRAGHGLGLSIVARAAELHGLRLEFRHPEDGGLEVALTRAAAS